MDAELIANLCKHAGKHPLAYAEIDALLEFKENGVVSVVGTVHFPKAWVVGQVTDPVEGHALKVHAAGYYHYIPFRLITFFKSYDFGYIK